MSHRTSDPSPFVVSHCHLAPKDGPVLDLACGKGRHTQLMLGLGYEVTAVDIDVSGVRDISTPNLTILEADLEGAPWPLENHAFGTIIVTNYLHRALFPHISATLKSGGLLLYETFAIGNENYGKPSNPDFLLQEDELRDVFAEGYEEVDYQQIDDGASVKQRLASKKKSQ